MFIIITVLNVATPIHSHAQTFGKIHLLRIIEWYIESGTVPRLKIHFIFMSSLLPDIYDSYDIRGAVEILKRVELQRANGARFPHHVAVSNAIRRESEAFNILNPVRKFATRLRAPSSGAQVLNRYARIYVISRMKCDRCTN